MIEVQTEVTLSNKGIPDTSSLILKELGVSQSYISRIEPRIKLIEDFFEWLNFNRMWNSRLHKKASDICSVNKQLSVITGTLDKRIKKQLKQKAVLRKIVEIMNNHDIDFIILKGSLLAEKIGLAPLYRFSKDIDLLVKEEQIILTDTALKKMGFVRKSPPDTVNEKQIKRYIKTNAHFTYTHPDWKTIIELHYKMERYFSLYPVSLNTIFNHAETIEWEGYPVKTMSPEETLLYLAVHGTHHTWFRLFWLRDFSLMCKKEMNWEYVFELAEHRGVSKILSCSLVLAKYVFNTALDNQVEEWLSANQVKQEIIDTMLKLTSTKKGDTDKWIQTTATLFKLNRGLKRKLLYLYLRFSSSEDWSLNLPGWLSFLYPLFKPWFVMKKILK